MTLGHATRRNKVNYRAWNKNFNKRIAKQHYIFRHTVPKGLAGTYEAYCKSDVSMRWQLQQLRIKIKLRTGDYISVMQFPLLSRNSDYGKLVWYNNNHKIFFH